MQTIPIDQFILLAELHKEESQSLYTEDRPNQLSNRSSVRPRKGLRPCPSCLPQRSYAGYEVSIVLVQSVEGLFFCTEVHVSINGHLAEPLLQ